MTQFIVQVRHVYLRRDADTKLTKYAYEAVTDWLKQWTCAANFKATLAPSQHDGILRVQAMLQEKLVPGCMSMHGVKPEHFEFEVSMQEAKDGWFWMPSGLVYGTRHPVVGNINWRG